MAVTKLIRKAQKNRARASNKVDQITRLKHVPPMPSVDVEKIKAEFRGEKPAEQPAPAETEQRTDGE